MKKIFTYLILSILVFASCSRSYVTKYDFGFDREELRFLAKDTASYFMVYGEGKWNLRMCEEAAWVNVDKFSGQGTTQVNVRIQKNTGVARDVELIASYDDGREKTLIISQEAATSISNAYTISRSELNLLKIGRDFAIPSTANFIAESLPDLQYWVEYDNEQKDWLEDVKFNYSDVTFSVKENTQDAARTAYLRWTFPRAHWENQDTMSVKIVQSSLLPRIELDESYSLDSEGRDSLKIPAKINWDVELYDFDLSSFTVSEGVKGEYSKSGNYLALIAEPNTSRDVHNFDLEWNVRYGADVVSSASTNLVQNFYIPPVHLTPNGEYANCYMLNDTEESYYSIDVRLVSGEKPADDIVSAAVLWETSLGLVNKCIYDPETNKLFVGKAKNAKGNAVIKLMAADGTIRWSYHFWMTDAGAALSDITIGGIEFMDRNVGALSNISPVANETDAAGLYYQWGRKDPFPAPTALNASSGSISMLQVYPEGAVSVEVQQNGVEFQTTIKNPGKYYWGSANKGAQDWCKTHYDEYWSTTEKTDLDPCPYGYVVPDKSQMETFVSKISSSTTHGFIIKDDNNKENYFCKGGYFRRKQSTTHFAHVGQEPHCWTTGTGENTETSADAKTDEDKVYRGSYATGASSGKNVVLYARRWGCNIRCVKQTKTDE